jgi:hypothetical protein
MTPKNIHIPKTLQPHNDRVDAAARNYITRKFSLPSPLARLASNDLLCPTRLTNHRYQLATPFTIRFCESVFVQVRMTRKPPAAFQDSQVEEDYVTII